MCNTDFVRIIFHYSEWQPSYKEFDKEVEFVEGLPQSSDFSNNFQTKLIIIDDFMRESSSNVIVDLFTKGSHHRNLTVFFISQNLYDNT